MEKIIAAAKCLQERGAYKIYVVATHGIFCDNSCELLSQSPITEACILIQTPLGRLKFSLIKKYLLEIIPNYCSIYHHLL